MIERYTEKKTLIIAEAGVNHNGELEIAKKLVDVAADAGADIVKFQTFKAEELVSKSATKASYQQRNSSSKADETQFQMLKKLEMSADMHSELLLYCQYKKIQFLSTAFDRSSVELLTQLGIRLFKIPSGEITNLPYLQQIGSYRGDVILSTGMADLGDIENALCVLTKAGTSLDNICVLHCTTEYPTPMEEVNLMAMNTIGSAFKVQVGYSDHTQGIEVAIGAVALGAKVVEKHFTLDRTMEGPDHRASLEPGELKEMINCIRNLETAIGSGIKQPTESELNNKPVARKSIHLLRSQNRGHILRESDLIMKRPGDGISPMKLFEVVGKSLRSNLEADHMLLWRDFE